MKEVHALFEVFGDGDGIERFNLLSVHATGVEAEIAAANLRWKDENNSKRYTPIDEIVHSFNSDCFHMRRVDYPKQLYRVSECGLGYGEFGGFVIEWMKVV